MPAHGPDARLMLEVEAIYERPRGVACVIWFGSLSRHQSWNGLAVCGRPGIAGTEARRGPAGFAADRAGPRIVRWNHRCPRIARAGKFVARHSKNRRRH